MNCAHMDELNRKACDWLVRGGIAAVGCSSMGAGSIGGKNYCGNLLWQSSLTLLPLDRNPPIMEVQYAQYT